MLYGLPIGDDLQLQCLDSFACSFLETGGTYYEVAISLSKRRGERQKLPTCKHLFEAIRFVQ